MYGASGFVEPGTELYEETNAINDTFGAQEQWVMLVPEGDWGRDSKWLSALKILRRIDCCFVRYGSVCNIPTDMVPSEDLSQLVSGGYSRIVVSTSVEGESEEAFSLVQTCVI